ncbi:hypothetical protein IBE10_02350 [Francisella tularensis subsp. novicida]|uniref:hypothetical protein n=1 Tax=Francisella tularensis TaxID=263 RepID=UPI0008FCED05|nr:hypothetical protein [Francisella tularensis]APC96068.1 S-adenosyl-L-homocysteine hydrolase family protein [Francisella tularensis subsp. novicida]MBK2345778.1 hypothetical protein [Francisella tularensis subsp. novicida]
MSLNNLITFNVITENYSNRHLEDVYLLGCQHILDSTFLLVEQLIKIGLKKDNISLIGKCYSTSNYIYRKFIDYGIYVCNSSKKFHKIGSFDRAFNKNVACFVEKEIKKIFKSGAKNLVIIDDGAEIIKYFNKHYSFEKNKDIKVIAVEQTTSGTNKLKNVDLKFPVVNIARSRAKLTLESPIIARRVIDILEKKIKKEQLFVKKILIIGMGAIGKALYNLLKVKYMVFGYDINSRENNLNQSEIINLIKDYDLIIGCTGTELFDPLLLTAFKKQITLVSASSSDREFMSYKLKILQSKYKNDSRKSIVYNNVTILNGGYPINFDGKKSNIPIDKIQITLALLAAGICQIDNKLNKGFNDLPLSIENQIMDLFDTVTKF